MNDRCKGALLGVSNVLLIAACYSIATTSGFADSPSQFAIGTRDDQATWSAWYLLIFFAVPFGAGLGALLGSLTESAGRGTQVGLAMLCLSVVAPLWPPAMPYAIPITILHAIALARWRSGQAKPRRPGSLAVVQKGAILGASAALTIAVAAAATVFVEPILTYDLLGTTWFVIDRRDPAARDLFLTTLMHAMPIAILWGALTGRVAHEADDCRWWVRACPVFFTAFSLVWFVAVVEPEVAPIVGAATLFHTLVLLRWTAAPRLPVLPVASVSRYDRLRSTSSRDARSTSPTPTPSDTSRTIRSA